MKPVETYTIFISFEPRRIRGFTTTKDIDQSVGLSNMRLQH